MDATLIVEAQMPDGSWKQLGPPMRAGSSPGSMSDNASDQRDIILFWVEHSHGYVARSVFGVDAADREARAVTSLGREVLATLSAGETFERTLVTDRGVSAHIRWRFF